MNKDINKSMNTTNIKNIIVYMTEDNICEFQIDTEIFADPFLEAATQAVEKSKKKQGGIIRPVTRCWDKKLPKKVRTYNSYFILINAGFYDKAELLREKFKVQTDIDLAKEPIHDAKSKP